MKKNSNIKYTESGAIELERFTKSQVKKLEQEIYETKYFPGIDYVEITGSDIVNTEKRFTVIKRDKSDYLYTLISSYLIIGLTALFGGVYYSEIKEIIETNYTQAFLILLGVITIFFSGLLYSFIRQREKRNKSILEAISKKDLAAEDQISTGQARIEQLKVRLKNLEEKLNKLSDQADY